MEAICIEIAFFVWGFSLFEQIVPQIVPQSTLREFKKQAMWFRA